MSKKVACLGWLTVPGLPPDILEHFPLILLKVFLPPRFRYSRFYRSKIPKHAKHTSKRTIKHVTTTSTSNNTSIHTLSQACEHNFYLG